MKRRRFIAGIYNYCDRWCERCPHTARCRTYFDSERAARRQRGKGKDPNDTAVAMETVSRSFEKARRMIARTAKKEGWDLNNLTASADIEAVAEKRRDRASRRHPLVKSAEAYMEKCGKLLERARPAFDGDREGAAERAEFMDVEAEADTLNAVAEAAHVLMWDHVLVTAKTYRAVNAKMGMCGEFPEWICQSDADGSAFVARNCLRRDMAALKVLYDWEDNLRDEIIDLLALAERVVRGLEKHFPGCVSYKWPPEEEE